MMLGGPFRRTGRAAAKRNWLRKGIKDGPKAHTTAVITIRVDDPLVLLLVAQYLHRTVDENLYSTVTRGISLGCPLSPVMALIRP